MGIKAGSGIKAGYSIQCKQYLSAKLRIFAGMVSWRLPTPEEQTITCGALKQGTITLGTLVETKNCDANL